MKHTPEDWRVRELANDTCAIYGQGEYDIITPRRFDGIKKADADRAVACVNACIGIEDPKKTIPQMREALEKVKREATYGYVVWGGAMERVETALKGASC